MTVNNKIQKNYSRLFISAQESEQEQGIIEGEIPSWLNGTFYRNGSAKFDIENFTFNHWLDGYTLLSKFVIKNGREITFESKFLRSEAYEKALQAKKNILPEYGTKGTPDRSKNIFTRFVSTILPVEFSDNCNACITQLGPALICTTDACYMRRITPALETREKYDTRKYWGLNGTCAHPLTDKDGTIYNIGFSALTGLKFNVLKMPPGGSYQEMMENATIFATIPSRWATAMACNHSFGLTANYIVLIEQPLVSTLAKVATKGGGSIKDLLEWRGENGRETNRFILVNKKSGKIFETTYWSKDAFFFLHFVNCFENDNEVVVDLITHRSTEFLDHFNLKNLRSCKLHVEDTPRVHRYRLPLSFEKTAEEDIMSMTNGKCQNLRVQPQTLCPEGMVGTTINPKYLGQKTNFFYGIGMMGQNNYANSICKIHADTKKIIFWKDDSLGYPGEPVFVQKPISNLHQDGKTLDEDEGVIISAVTNAKNGKDFLVILDAKNMKEIARVKFSAHVPVAVHGIFVPS